MSLVNRAMPHFHTALAYDSFFLSHLYCFNVFIYVCCVNVLHCCGIILSMKSALISTSNGSPISNGYESSSEPTSIHSGIINEVYDIPMKEITRPFLPALNENKVQSFMTTIQVTISYIFGSSK